MRQYTNILIATAAVLIMSSGAASANATQPEISKVFRASNGLFREEFIAQSLASFRRASATDGVIDTKDAERQLQVMEARNLANAVARFISSDLDRDGFITAEEMAATGQGMPDNTLQAMMTRWDTNGDGTVSKDEWFVANPVNSKRNDFNQISARGRFNDYLELDPNGDGSLTADEFRSVASKVFSRFDENSDGQISKDELVTWERTKAAGEVAQIEKKTVRGYDATRNGGRQSGADIDINAFTTAVRNAAGEPTARVVRNSETPLVLPLPGQKPRTGNHSPEGEKCAFPELKPNEKLAVYSTYEGVVPTSLDLGAESWLIDVAVESGNDPLYVVLPSYDPIVWRFSGAVDRISRVVATSMVRGDNSSVGPGGPGVVGIDASKVSFLEGWQCLEYYNGPVEEAQMRGRIEGFLGRQPDHKASSYHTEKLAIPSMTVEKGTSTPPWSDGGPQIVDIEPGTVVAANPVKRFDVLPGRHGLRQLTEAGYLEKIPNDNGHENYRIIKHFPKFPVGMTGGMQPTFLLAPGVQKPEGSTGWACVIDEASGKVVAGSGGPMCR